MFQFISVTLGCAALALVVSGAVAVGLTFALITLLWVAAAQPASRRRPALSEEELRRRTIQWLPPSQSS